MEPAKKEREKVERFFHLGTSFRTLYKRQEFCSRDAAFIYLFTAHASYVFFYYRSRSQRVKTENLDFTGDKKILFVLV